MTVHQTPTPEPIRRTSPAAPIDPATFHLARTLADSAVRFADRPAQRVATDDGGWQVTSYAEFWRRAQALGRALLARGLESGERVAIFSNNRPEWSVVDYATLAAGGIVVPIFAASSAEQVRHVITDSGSRFVFVDGVREAELLARALDGLDQRPEVFGFDPVEGLTTLEAMVAEGHHDHADELARRLAAGTPDDVATIVYTSGTTGVSKGVMLTHGGFGNQSAAIDACWDFQPTDHSVCFLPLAHSLERDWSFHLVHCGCMNTYCHNPKQIGELLPRARPTLLVGVPMFFEKVMAGARAQATGPAAKVMEWALRVGGQCQHAYRKGKEPALFWRAQLPLADRLVLRKIRDAVGGNKTLLVSGGAPLRREAEEFFSAIGILLGQGYGLTESGPMMTIYRSDHYKLGTVGFCIRGSQIRIGAGGEVLVKGPSVMKGYWNNPEATAEVIKDGWLHTGDVGHVDRDGFIVITDRLKDIIVTANGKNVAPQSVEAALMADPVLDQAIVVGDGRPCLVAVLQPSRQGWSTLADELGLPDDPSTLAASQRVREALATRAAGLTEHLAHHERVRGVVVSHDRISLASGLLTATMKLRRRQVEQVFAREIDALYAELRRRRQR